MHAYSSTVEKHMLALYESLSEKDRRRYAAVEAEKLGHGGIQYVSQLFGCDADTVRRGGADVDELPSDEAAGRIRKKGRPQEASVAQPGLVDAVEASVADHTAGSPVDPNILWTNRSPQEIADEVRQAGFSACAETIRKILTEELGLSIRQAENEEATRRFEFRDEQFEHIASRRRWYEFLNWSILSIDTKKKELLGNFRRPGRAYTNGHVRVFDHDFSTLASGRLVPYGVYDVQRNEGFMLLTETADTSELACDAVRRWWRRWGSRHYKQAKRLLLLCDCGGSNGYRQYRFKEDLTLLANDLGIPIEVQHYPPGCSKYNPIERRMFCHVTRALKGVVLRSIHVARDFIKSTHTATGLRVDVEIARKIYRKGRKATYKFRETMPIHFQSFLPELNYAAGY